MAERPRELCDFKKALVNGGTENDSVKDSCKCLRCRWQTRITGNQTICSILGLDAKYRSRRWMWSTLPTTIRCLEHSLANEVDSVWDYQPLTFTQKNEKIAFWAILSGLRGNVRTPSMGRWKARGRLYIRHNWTVFAISYGWDVMSGNRSKLAFFEGGGSLSAQISEGRGMAHQLLLVSEN